MAAVAFVQTVIFMGAQNKRVLHVPMTVSDVNAEYAISPDGNGFIQLPSDQPYRLVDVIVETGGTDTKFQDIYANGLQTGLRITNKANLNSSNFRQFQSAPVTFVGGSLLRLKQATA